MKRLRAWLFDGIAWISLVLALMAGLDWASRLLPRQFWIRDSFVLWNAQRYSIDVGGGTNVFFVRKIERAQPPIVGPLASDPVATAAFENQFGPPLFGDVLSFKTFFRPMFGVDSAGHTTMDGYAKSFGLGYGWIVLFLLIVPTFRWLGPVRQWIRSRYTIPPGHCKNCGYDLRATPNQCPECGNMESQTP